VYTSQDVSDNLINGNYYVIKDDNYFNTETLITYIDNDISGNTGVISKLLESHNLRIENIIFKDTDLGTSIIQKGKIGLFDLTNNIILSDELNNEITMMIADIPLLPGITLGFLAISTPIQNELLQFYFKIINSFSLSAFVNELPVSFKCDLAYSQTTKPIIDILRYNNETNAYVNDTEATFIENTQFTYQFTILSNNNNSHYLIAQLLPDPPTNIVLSQVQNNLNITFTPPTYTGPNNESITQYKVYWSPNNNSDTIDVNDIINNTIIISSLSANIEYTIYITAININGESNPTNNYQITLINNIPDLNIINKYKKGFVFLETNGKYLLFKDFNKYYDLLITADCYRLTDNERLNLRFTNNLIKNCIFMRTVNIYYKDVSMIINMNTLNVEYNKHPDIVVGKIYSDRAVIYQLYTKHRLKEIITKINFNGISRKIYIRNKMANYTIKISADLNCSDIRNNIIFENKNNNYGFGSLINSNESFLLSYL
jgi:hypothetical protein